MQEGIDFTWTPTPVPTRRKLDDFEDEVGNLSFLEYYGTQELERDFLAYVLPQDGTSPHPQRIQAVTLPCMMDMPLARPKGLGPSRIAEWNQIQIQKNQKKNRIPSHQFQG